MPAAVSIPNQVLDSVFPCKHPTAASEFVTFLPGKDKTWICSSLTTVRHSVEAEWAIKMPPRYSVEGVAHPGED